MSSMAVCPHCGKTLDVNPRRQVPWWKYDPGPTANLGCGTLILIAIIVAMFSSRSTESVARLEQEVRTLQEKIDGLGRGIEKLLPPAGYDLREYDLRLMSWGDGSGVPASGKKLVILGIDNDGRLHIRSFDADGKLTDTDETKLPPAQVGAIAALKHRIPGLLPPHVLTSAETTQLQRDLTSILGQTPPAQRGDLQNRAP
jgi:hypothetical protein